MRLFFWISIFSPNIQDSNKEFSKKDKKAKEPGIAFQKLKLAKVKF